MSTDLTAKDNATYSNARWQMLPLQAITLTGGFWSQRQKTNRNTTLPHGYRMLEESGNFHNLQVAAGLIEGEYRGREFLDSDVYKWLEAASYELHLNPNNPTLQKQVDQAIDLIAAAQQDDGYVNSYFQVTQQGQRWVDLDFGHELYCAGHLFQAAVAHYRATQDTKLLNVATRFADLLCATFGPDKHPGAPGHPVIEMALVALYQLTGKQEYLDLAKFFIDERGKGVMRGLGWANGPAYHQDRVPVRQASVVEGHAVRAMYLNAGVTDLYLETGEQALFDALTHQWHDMVSHKLFITGGLGSRYEGESFGDPYELSPDQCYCETCAAIGSVMWNWRMLLATGEGRYADLIERTLYNGILSGLGADGLHFFYINPLMSRGGYERQKWYGVACCPPNIMRLLASIGQYFATSDPTGLQIHLYNTGTINITLPSGFITDLAVETDYPWEGKVKLTVRNNDDSEWILRLRIPGWCQSAKVTLNGTPMRNVPIENGYLLLDRAWMSGDVVELEFALSPQLIEANPRVDAIRSSVAVQYGPLIYCFEEINTESGLSDIYIDGKSTLEAVWRDNILPEKIKVIETTGHLVNPPVWQDNLYRPLTDHNQEPISSQPVSLTGIPYYAWGNGLPGAMRVWIPLFDKL